MAFVTESAATKRSLRKLRPPVLLLVTELTAFANEVVDEPGKINYKCLFN